MKKMFKKSQIQLAEDIFDMTVPEATSFYQFIVRDKETYDGCENNETIQVTVLFYLFTFFYDAMVQKYNDEDSFKVMYTLVASSTEIKSTPNECFRRFLTLLEERNKVIDSDRESFEKDEYQVLTQILFSFIIKDKDLLLKHLKTSFTNCSSFKMIKMYMETFRENLPINFELYDLRKK